MLGSGADKRRPEKASSGWRSVRTAGEAYCEQAIDFRLGLRMSDAVGVEVGEDGGHGGGRDEAHFAATSAWDGRGASWDAVQMARCARRRACHRRRRPR
eukprot:ctg_1348.g492